jgi:hypothetical protein
MEMSLYSKKKKLAPTSMSSLKIATVRLLTKRIPRNPKLFVRKRNLLDRQKNRPRRIRGISVIEFFGRTIGRSVLCGVEIIGRTTIIIRTTRRRLFGVQKIGRRTTGRRLMRIIEPIDRTTS